MLDIPDHGDTEELIYAQTWFNESDTFCLISYLFYFHILSPWKVSCEYLVPHGIQLLFHDPAVHICVYDTYLSTHLHWPPYRLVTISSPHNCLPSYLCCTHTHFYLPLLHQIYGTLYSIIKSITDFDATSFLLCLVPYFTDDNLGEEVPKELPNHHGSHPGEFPQGNQPACHDYMVGCKGEISVCKTVDLIWHICLEYVLGFSEIK